MCVEALLKSAIRYRQLLVRRAWHKDKQACDWRAEAALKGYLLVLES